MIATVKHFIIVNITQQKHIFTLQKPIGATLASIYDTEVNTLL